MNLCMIFSKDHTILNMTFLPSLCIAEYYVYWVQNLMKIRWSLSVQYCIYLGYVIDTLFSQDITVPRSREEMKHNTFHIFIFDYQCLCLWLWRFSTTALVLWKQDFCVGEANWKIKRHKILFYLLMKMTKIIVLYFPFSWYPMYMHFMSSELNIWKFDTETNKKIAKIQNSQRLQ